MKERNLINKASIINKEKEMLDAMLNSDVDKLSALIHEDLLFNIPSGQTVTKDLDLENYRSGNMKIKVISSSDQSINLIEDIAVVAATITMRGSYLAHILDGKYRIIRIWKLFGNDWKVVAGSSVQI